MTDNVTTGIHALFRQLRKLGGSDLHLAQGYAPRIRVDGHLQDLMYSPLDQQVISAYLESLVGKTRFQEFLVTGDLDLAVELGEDGRYRGNYLKTESGLGAVFRAVPDSVISFDELDLPPVLTKLVSRNEGILLVTGPTGSGKSTTLAAMVDQINNTVERKIVTIEDPIEVIFQPKKSFISQREVGTHTDSFGSALRATLGEDPDVIVVTELRDAETMALALTAAEMGFLVLATLHTNGAAKTVERVVDMFPDSRQTIARQQLASALIGIVSQLLLPRSSGRGRVAAVEVLVSSLSLSNLIRDRATHQIPSVMQSGIKIGCQTMDQAIMALVQSGTVGEESARQKLRDKRLLPKPQRP